MADHATHVKKYIADADDKKIAAIVKYCGIALQNKDSSLVSCSDKDELATVRNGFYLPKFKASMITEEYLRNVISGKAYCPKYEEVKILPCPHQPTVDVLLKKFHKLCSDRNLS